MNIDLKHVTYANLYGHKYFFIDHLYHWVSMNKYQQHFSNMLRDDFQVKTEV